MHVLISGQQCLSYEMFKVFFTCLHTCACESSTQLLSLAFKESHSWPSAVCCEAPPYHTTSLVQWKAWDTTVVLYFDRRLIIWLCQAGWTKSGMARQLMTNCVQWKTWRSVCVTVSRCWSGYPEVCGLHCRQLDSSVCDSSLEIVQLTEDMLLLLTASSTASDFWFKCLSYYSL